MDSGRESVISHALRWTRRSSRLAAPPPGLPKPAYLVDIVVSSGDEIEQRLAEQGLAPDEVVLKYCWPRYAPPPGSGIRLIGKFENLGHQFERLVAMHRAVPSSIPMPVGTVRNADGELVGYVLEYASGDTLETLIGLGHAEAAETQLRIVEETVEKLHAKSIVHGDVNASNVIAADDGRTLLIDPIPVPGPGTRLQDELCLADLRRRVEALGA
jgi:serine/threonine protein kinase